MVENNQTHILYINVMYADGACRVLNMNVRNSCILGVLLITCISVHENK